MPQYCCVPMCKSAKGGHLFPKSPRLQMEWRVAIKRIDPKTGKLWMPNMNHDVVCHSHFTSNDYRLPRYLGRPARKMLKMGAVPSIFDFTSKTAGAGIQSDEKMETMLMDLKDSIFSQDIANEVVVPLDVEADGKISHKKTLQDASTQSNENSIGTGTGIGGISTFGLPSNFSLRKFYEDPKAIHYFTGLDNYNHFLLIKSLFDPLIDQLECQCDQIPIVDQLFLTLTKLRLALDDQLLGYFFGVSEALVTKIFSSWITFMHDQLKKIDIWPSKKTVQDTMPQDFKEQYSATRVIIDTIEFPIEKPADDDAQKQTLSTNKNMHMIKLLVGITPKGAISYIGDCYGGAMSDRQVFEKSLLYKEASSMFELGDSIMVDKELLIQDLFSPFAISIITPSDQHVNVCSEEVPKQVCVKQIISRATAYKILQAAIPTQLLPLCNKIVFVVLMFVNFQPSVVGNNLRP